MGKNEGKGEGRRAGRNGRTVRVRTRARARAGGEDSPMLPVLWALQNTEYSQDWYNPGSMGKQYFLGLEKGFSGSGDPAYPGRPFFNPLGFGKDEKSMKELKLKDIKNGRFAMFAVLVTSFRA